MTYETIARLGRGGMGVVDLARDPEGNKVALKRLTLHGSANDIIRARQRLLREAEVLRRLHHPNVVRLVDVIDEGDEIVLVMPYLSGGSLAERVAQHGPAPADEVERQARRLFGALAQAHQLGIIHRDIKPANILFDDRGEPCLADFGVAQTWDQTHGLTVSGMVVGTPGFMAPEQARGEQALPASDVFSLGATLLFAATGDGPFGAGDPALLMVRAASNKVEKVPRSLPSSLRRLLSDTLAARPERRPSAAAVVGSPQGFMAGLPSVPRPRSGLSWAIVLGVAGAILLVLGAVAFVAGREGSDNGTQSPDRGVVPSTSGDAPTAAPPGDTPGESPSATTADGGCAEGYLDEDGDPANGCQPVADTAEPAVLRLFTSAPGTIVSGEVDAFELILDAGEPPDCRMLAVTLSAPESIGLQLDVGDDAGIIGSASTLDDPTVAIPIDPCGTLAGQAGEAMTYQATVRPVGDQPVDTSYTLSFDTAASGTQPG